MIAIQQSSYIQQNFSDETLIEGLPNEIVMNIFAYLPCDAVAKSSRVCRRWKIALCETISNYQIETIFFNFFLYSELHKLYSVKTTLLKKIHKEISSGKLFNEVIPTFEKFELLNKKTKNPVICKTKEFFNQQIRKKKIRYYPKMLSHMQEIALERQGDDLLLFEFSSNNYNKFQQYAVDHLVPLENIICTRSSNLKNLFQSLSIDKVKTLYLSRTVCYNWTVLEHLEKIIPQKQIENLYLIGNSAEKKDFHYAFGMILKIIEFIGNNNLTIGIQKFHMNDLDAAALAEAIQSESIKTCILSGEQSITNVGLKAIAQSINLRKNKNFNFLFEYYDDEAIQEGLNTFVKTIEILQNENYRGLIEIKKIS